MKFYKKIILLSSLFYLCSNNARCNEQVINENWEFVKIEEVSSNNSKIQNQGTGWETQFNVEHADYGGKLSIDRKIINNEKHIINSKHWEIISLPHSANIEPLIVKHQWQGICYYKKQFVLNSKQKNKEIFIRFEGAMQLADIWINGKYVGQHAGGYTPFVFKISKFLFQNKLNTILVRLDNNNNKLIPPGKPLEKLDFCYFSGLYRSVKIIAKNKIYITDPIFENKVASGGVFVTYSNVTNSNATIDIKTHIKNNYNKKSNIVIENILLLNNEVKKLVETSISLNKKSDKQISQTIKLKNPKLWDIENPTLYSLKTIIKLNNVVVDEKITKIGIRKIYISRTKGFLLNNIPLRLVGTNRHMEYPFIGNAISENSNYRDLIKIKESGFNLVRLGHYPQDKSVYDICDEIGLLIINPTPGWQYFNSDSIFCQITYQNIQDMIRRDRNHPSVIMWETILNESWPPKWWKDKANDIAHKEYPTNQFFTSGDMYGYSGWDILYNDWKEDHTRPSDSIKPGFIREYGDYEFGGHFSTSRVIRLDGQDALLKAAWNHQWSHNKHRTQYPSTIGDAIWSMYDYNRGCCDNICYSGISDIFRYPKFSYYFYRSQINIGTKLTYEIMKPEVFIANYWNNDSKSSKVIVYGNVEKVELKINGKSVKTQYPDSGNDTKYINSSKNQTEPNLYDGGNCKNLAHPPFTFTNINWEKGTLEAVGYVDNKPVARYNVKTPEKASQLSINIDMSGVSPSILVKDELFIYVDIKDIDGTICTNNVDNVEIEVINAKLLSPKTTKAEAGVAAFLIQTIVGEKQIIINAKLNKHISKTKILVIR